jgi:ankyrin repeat protein
MSIQEEAGGALQTASFYRMIQMVRLLLRNGAKVNARRGELGTALYEALSRYKLRYDVVGVLLEHRAELTPQERKALPISRMAKLYMRKMASSVKMKKAQ